jgi:hypothetical protein
VDNLYNRIANGEFDVKLPNTGQERMDAAYGARQRFCEACVEDAGLSHALGQLVFSHAWEAGHSAGLHAVWAEFQDLCEFVEEVTTLVRGN